MTYSIKVNGTFFHGFAVPTRLPIEGDLYEAVSDIHTLGGYYPRGSKFRVIARTNQSRHDRFSTLGNLVLETPRSLSIWTEFDHSLARGSFKLIDINCNESISLTKG